MNRDFRKIEKWILKNGYTIRFGIRDLVDYEKKEILLRKNQKNLIYSALHECGHVILCNDKSYSKKYKSLLKAEMYDARHYKSNIYKYKKIKEEIEAWEKGLKLAKKLGIKINIDDYEIYASKYIMSYAKYL